MFAYGNMIRYDPTIVNLISNFFVLCTKVKDFLYNYSNRVELSISILEKLGLMAYLMWSIYIKLTWRMADINCKMSIYFPFYGFNFDNFALTNFHQIRPLNTY